MVAALMSVVALLATVAAGASALLGGHQQPAPTTQFGGPAPVHIVHPGQIELDLEPDSSTGLQREPCPGNIDRATVCFVWRTPAH